MKTITFSIVILIVILSAFPFAARATQFVSTAKERRMRKKLIITAVMVFPLFLCACSTSLSVTRQDKEYYGFHTRLFADNKNLVKSKTLNEVEPVFWESADKIPITIYENKRIITFGIGKIDVFNTAKDTVLTGGINLLSPNRLKDPEFQQKLNQSLEFSKLNIDDYIFQELKKGTTKVFERKASEGSLFTLSPIPKTKEMILDKRNIFILPGLMLMPRSMRGWSEPKYRLLVSLGIIIATDDAIYAWNKRFPGKSPIFTGGPMGNKQLGRELRKSGAFPGMYFGSIFKNSECYSKEEWLANNGAFLEKQIKSALEYLVQEADCLLFSAK